MSSRYDLEHMPTSSHFGGIALFVKNGIDYVKRDDLSTFIYNGSESIFIELKRTQGKNIIIII